MVKPVLIWFSPGPCVLLLAVIEWMKHKSSTCSPSCGSKSETYLPDCPRWRNAKGFWSGCRMGLGMSPAFPGPGAAAHRGESTPACSPRYRAGCTLPSKRSSALAWRARRMCRPRAKGARHESARQGHAITRGRQQTVLFEQCRERNRPRPPAALPRKPRRSSRFAGVSQCRVVVEIRASVSIHVQKFTGVVRARHKAPRPWLSINATALRARHRGLACQRQLKRRRACAERYRRPRAQRAPRTRCLLDHEGTIQQVQRLHSGRRNIAAARPGWRRGNRKRQTLNPARREVSVDTPCAAIRSGQTFASAT